MSLRIRTLLSLAIVCALGVTTAHAQCMLANPSFEVLGTAGETFQGWNEFGDVGLATPATHGVKAARLSGRDLGGWELSAFWQRLDTLPGEQWSASVKFWHSSANPLLGSARALLNIEWRDEFGALIDYETHVLATASTPADEIQTAQLQSLAAPTGTASTHFLIAVQQGPFDPKPDVFFDEANFENRTPQQAESEQWGDFPGGRVINFRGLNWRVKGPGLYDPGSAQFCDAPECIWVDAQDRMHMTLQQIDGVWSSTELVLETAQGYGDYILTTRGRLDDFELNVVFGFFLWQYGLCYDPALRWWNPYNEIDIEFGRWGSPLRDVAQFVAQPYEVSGNMLQFDPVFVEDELTSHAFRWLPDRVEFRSWRGGPLDEFPENMIAQWTYDGPYIPRPEQPRVHLNLWSYQVDPSVPHEVVIEDFQFVAEAAGQVLVAAPPVSDVLLASLSPASPNPFNPNTALRYAMHSPGEVEIAVFDMSGRLVRRLVSEFKQAGDYETHWNGSDANNRSVASGVYVVRLRSGSTVQTERVTLLK